MRFLLLVLLLPAFTIALDQKQSGDATTKGSCSPATTGSHNSFVITCGGVDAQQQKKILDLLNGALRSGNDANAKLDELLALVNKRVPPIQLAATIGNPKNLSLQVENKSDRTAEGLLWQVILIRESDLTFFSFATQDIGYQKGLSKGTPYELGLETRAKVDIGSAAPLTKGDILTGGISVDCPDCTRAVYILHLVWGESGWSCPFNYDGLPTPKDMSQEGRRKFLQIIDEMTPLSCRTPIL